MCFDNDGYVEFAEDRVVKARKPHKCTECGGAIGVAEQYHHYSGKFDGHFFVEKICRRCEFDRLRVVEHELAEGCHWDEAWPPFGGLVDYLHESELGQTRTEDVPTTFRVGDMPKEHARAIAEIPS
jgi:hypothetical protein